MPSRRRASTILGGKIVDPLIQLARELGGNDSAFRRKTADYAAAVAGIDNQYARVVVAMTVGRPVGLEGSIAKIALTRWLQEVSIFALDQAGPWGTVADGRSSALGRIQDAFLTSPGFRIGGGTEEIHLNIIGERILGLPKG